MRWVGLVLLFITITACGSGLAGPGGDTNQELRVFAAASLTDAFKELGQAFEARNPGVQVIFHFAGSSQLAAQLREGVTADVFAAANPDQMQAVVEAGLIAPDAPVVFATNRLTIVVPRDNPASISGLADLGRPGVQLILGLKGVPIRTYTDQVVATMPASFQQQFYGNLVSEENNVRQVAAKVALGEADAGIVYRSDITADIADKVQLLAIPDGQNVVATYPIAPLLASSQSDPANAWIDFILGEEGQVILSRWGFGPAAGTWP